MELTQTEENYLKALYRLTSENDRQQQVSSTELSVQLSVKPASVNEMLKKLKEKSLVSYIKYGKISLTASGLQQAIHVVRKHRIWETFLYQELEYKGEEVHEIAEQLEHIQSPDLIDRLFNYLGKPKKDPHGEIIPKTQIESASVQQMLLPKGKIGIAYTITGFKELGKSFLDYMEKVGLHIGDIVVIEEKHTFDQSFTLLKNKQSIHISEQVALAILISA
ncbi:MAG: iron-dependent repressor [Pseudopedobacter saltans]|uniref:Transcriptional regulator MntR n=1 Tax=Pseudopedobacter saltans TaxID=151895 RepID=A0A2W5EU64_9SPHI|nr:MAG: iron-dependent repressor [Pseudopedobacter saltans]